MLDVLGKLTQYWRARGLIPRAGYDRLNIAQAEKRLGVEFCEQFYEYVLVSGGFGSRDTGDQDADGFRFWALDRLTTAEQEYALKTPPESAPPGGRRLVVFADYLDWSWAYAINTEGYGADSGAVFMLGGERPVRVTASLLDFFEVYMTGHRSLFR